jgi:hypothetical protein
MALLLVDASQTCASTILLVLLMELKWGIIQSYNVRTKFRQNLLDG